jgi:hypothetical protein
MAFRNVLRHNIIKAVLIVNGSVHRIIALTAYFATGLIWWREYRV